MGIVRLAKFEDVRRIWEIRNHPEVRKVSGNPEEISYSEHEAWFRKKYFESPGQDVNFCFVLEDGGGVIGYCRFDLEDDGLIVSIAVDPAYQGKGLGIKLLSESMAQLPQGAEIKAEIKIGNQASLRLFEKNNFQICKQDSSKYYLKYSPPRGTLEKTIRGGKWVVATTITSKVLGVVSFLVLARYLDPLSYGLIAIVFILVGLFGQIGEFGFDRAVIQRKGSVEEYMDAVWTIDMLKAIAVFVVLYFAAPLVARFFHAEAAVTLLRWSGIFAVLPALAPIRQLVLFRNFDFRKLYFRDISGQVAYVVIGLLWVFFVSRDVWALFFANLGKTAVSVLAIYYYFPALPRLQFDFRKLKELFPYSKWIMGQSLVDYLISQVDSVIVGRALSPTILGFYSKARNVSGTALSVISSMMKSLSFVAFSKVQDAGDKVKAGFLMGLDLILVLGFMNIVLLWLGGEAIVKILLGQQWLGMVPALKIFAFSATFAAVIALVYSLFDGVGKPSVNFKMKVISTVLYAVLAYIGIHYKSMAGAALGVTAANLLVMSYAFYKLTVIYQLKISEIFSRVFLIFIPMLVATLIFFPLFLVFPRINPFGIIIILGGYFLTFLALFWWWGRKQEGFWMTFSSVLKFLK